MTDLSWFIFIGEPVIYWKSVIWKNIRKKIKKFKKVLDFFWESDIIIMLRLTEMHTTDADWCNGSTTDSDSVCRGSNPLSVAFLLLK